MRASRSFTRPLASGGAALALVALAVAPALAISVTVNGQAVTFQPPPIERAGRVFVPLRGVFERLGASVVYQSGTINATGNGRAIQLHIGSTQALVNGQPQAIDEPPFVVGASTYVPLRFVSEALGAGVNYDAANQLVALNTAGGQAAPQGPPPPATHLLREREPGAGAAVGSQRPTISATFARPVDPNSIRIALDGLDVTRDATRSPSGFIYAPNSPLQSMVHTVQVTGQIQGAQPFTEMWRFTSGAVAATNNLTIVAPADGTPVGNNFTVRGHTVANALIHIDAGASANFAGRSFAFGPGNVSVDTTADGNGNFEQPVAVRAFPGATIGVTVTSTDPSTRESAQRKLQLPAQ